MIRNILIVLLFAVILPLAGWSQTNIVRNGSFEQYAHCPYGIDQIAYANYWSPTDSVYDPSSISSSHSGPLCAPQYCNTCDTIFGWASVPFSQAFNYYPRNGKGMAQMAMYYDDATPSAYQREYLQGRFYNTLTAGKSYCATFYVIMNQGTGYAINHVGAYLDDGSIDAGEDSFSCSLPQTTFTPQIDETAIIDDTLNWTKVQGSFTANGTERFITIGDFFSVANTDTTVPFFFGWSSAPGETEWAYYCIDDVSVIASDATANAGPDAVVSVGDSVLIGPANDDGLPATWYVSGDTTPIGYGSNIWVHPTVNTTYVMELDLCGNVTRDSMMVRIVPTSAGSVQAAVSSVQVWPNPAGNELTISAGEQIRSVVISNVVGQVVASPRPSPKEREVLRVNVAELPAGVYFVKINDSVVRKFVKE